MSKLYLNQNIPFRQKIIIGLPLIAIGILVVEESILFSAILFVLGVLIFFLRYKLLILKPYRTYYCFSVLSLEFLKIKKKLFFPDYISLFHQSFIQSNNVGFNPKILGDSNYKLYTIKFFKENKNTIIFGSSNKQETTNLAKELSNFLNVKLHNTLE